MFKVFKMFKSVHPNKNEHLLCRRHQQILEP